MHSCIGGHGAPWFLRSPPLELYQELKERGVHDDEQIVSRGASPPPWSAEALAALPSERIPAARPHRAGVQREPPILPSCHWSGGLARLRYASLASIIQDGCPRRQHAPRVHNLGCRRRRAGQRAGQRAKVSNSKSYHAGRGVVGGGRATAEAGSAEPSDDVGNAFPGSTPSPALSV